MSTTSSATSQRLAEWVKVFPRQVCETHTGSVTFMKQLTVIALSTIMYLKNVFPVENYTRENFGGIKQLNILKKECKDDIAQFVSTALTQAFEAFDKKYLHQLVLCFHDGECDLTEYHVFEYKYTREEVIMELHSKNRDNVMHSTRYTFDTVREKTLALIRGCVVISQMFSQYQPSSDISLRLYYNEDAPEGYQAPGFVAPPPGEMEDPLDPGSAEHVLYGKIETPFHHLKASSYIPDRTGGSSNEANASLTVPIMTQYDSEKLCSGDVEFGLTSEGDAMRVQCPCNKHFLGEEVMLTCEYCKTQQHASCYGVLRAAAASRARHCCLRCSDAEPTRAPADANLTRLPHKERESLCIYRLALTRCASLVRVSAAQLAAELRLTARSAAKLCDLLHKQGLLLPGDDDLDSPREINQEKLKDLMSKFLPYPEATDMIDRLVAESLSQGSQPDPVSNVLDAMEKVNLQNATTMGKIVEYTQTHAPDSVVEDFTLKQYREAILSSDQQMDEELPMSGIRPLKIMKKIGKKTTKRKIDDPKNKQLMSGLKTKKAKAMPE